MMIEKVFFDPGVYVSLKRNPVFTLLTVVLLVVSLALIARSVALGYNLARPVPYMDQWEFAKRIPNLLDGKESFADLFSQHNEHLIFTSRLVFIFDAIFFDYSSYFCIYLVYFLCIFIAFLFARMIGDNYLIWWVFLSGVLLSPVQHENLSGGFQVAFPIVQICTILSITSLVRYVSAIAGSAWFLVAAMIFDLLAIFSLASGVLLIVSAIWIGVVYRHSLRKLLPYLMCHCLGTWAFFLAYSQSGGVKKSFKILKVLEFSVIYLGDCLRDYGFWAALTGSIAITLLIFAMVTVVRRSRRQDRGFDRHQVSATAIGLFTVAGAALTGVGRVSLGLEAASASRYAFFSIIMICALFTFYWRETCADASRRSNIVRVILSLVLLTVSTSSNLSARSMGEWRARIQTNDAAGFALANGVWSDQKLQLIYPLPDLIKETLLYLARRRLAMFSPRFASIYKPPLNAVQDQSLAGTRQCEFRIDSVIRTGPHWIEMTGSASGGYNSKQENWIVVLDDARHLLGYTRQPASEVEHASDRVGFDIALNEVELSAVGESSLTFVMVPNSPSRDECREQVTVELPPQ